MAEILIIDLTQSDDEPDDSTPSEDPGINLTEEFDKLESVKKRRWSGVYKKAYFFQRVEKGHQLSKRIRALCERHELREIEDNKVLMEDSTDEEDAQEPEDFPLLTTPPGGTTPPEGTVLQVNGTELQKFFQDVNSALLNNLETPPSRAPLKEPPPLLHPAVKEVPGAFAPDDDLEGYPTSMDRCTLCTTEQDLQYWQDGQWFCPLCFEHKQEIDDLPSLVCDHCGMVIVQSTTEPDMKRTHWYVHDGDTYLAGQKKKICYVCHEHALGIHPYYAGTPHNGFP